MAGRRTTKSTAAKRKPNRQSSSNQFWSVIFFAAGVLLLMLALIKGESAWFYIHNFLLGMFGISAYIVPVIFVYISIMIAMDKSTKAVAGKVIQGSILILLVSGAMQIFVVGAVYGDTFLEKLIRLYTDGIELKSGGMFSAVLGWPLLALFQKNRRDYYYYNSAVRVHNAPHELYNSRFLRSVL